MIAHQELIESVAEHADSADTGRMREAVAAVLATVAHSLPAEERERLAGILPGTFTEAVLVPGQTESHEGHQLVIEIAERLGTSPERARYLAQAVFDGLQDEDPGLVDTLRSRVRSDVFETVSPDGDSPRRAESIRPEVPTELTEDEIRDALERLPTWNRTGEGIARTVELPDDRHRPLIDNVQRVAREHNDHAKVSTSPGAVTFTLRTGESGVTGADIRLAERIDQVVREIGGGG